MAMKQKTIILNKERDVTLTPFLIQKQRTPAILILPGGAYTTCDESEGIPVANAFHELGFQAFILRYSVGKHYKWPYPLEDFEQAMEYLIRHADELCIEPEHIIAAGFSAGGHLAAMAASAARHKPFATIICYGAAKEETIQYKAPGAPDASKAVTLDTCPCFLASSRTDWIVPVENTLEFVEALTRHYIDYELHIYGYAMHGFSVGEKAGAKGPLFCSRVDDWLEESVSWIDDLISGRYMSIRENAEYNDAYARTLSTRNSCKIIFADPDAVKLLRHRFLPQYLIYEAAKKQIGPFIETITLKNLLQFMKVKEKTLRKMDQMLASFPLKKNP